MDLIRIATRESKLALWQAEFVKQELLRQYPSMQVELVKMTTKGDRWLSAPLSEVGGKGLFIKELETAMLDGRADIAVHSMKDLPAQLPAGFVLPVIAYRAALNDVLMSAYGQLKNLPQNAKVGSSSLRRKAQLLSHRPDLEILPIRGNVGTRLEKLENGEFDAIVLAQAGLERLGISFQQQQILPLEMSLPAPGQAALGVECLAENVAVQNLLAPLNDVEVHACVSAERGVSLAFGADCSLPIAALAQLVDGEIRLQARIASADGKQVLASEAQGDSPSVVAQTVSEALINAGANDILAQLRD